MPFKVIQDSDIGTTQKLAYDFPVVINTDILSSMISKLLQIGNYLGHFAFLSPQGLRGNARCLT